MINHPYTVVFTFLCLLSPFTNRPENSAICGSDDKAHREALHDLSHVGVKTLRYAEGRLSGLPKLAASVRLKSIILLIEEP
jgi:hypothetical protein